MKRKFYLFFVLVLILGFGMIGTASADGPSAVLLASGLEGGSGSTVGPDGALYVTERFAGRVLRIDPQTGDVTTFVSGLPPALIPVGGAMDVAFIDGTAYVLVTMVGDDMPFFPVNNGDIVGIYRVDGPDTVTPVVDIGSYSIANPSQSIVFIPSGVQYAMEAFRGGFLVTDGHHNRVLWANLNGEVSEVMAFGNIVPTGLEVWGNRVFMSEAGPNPHLPENGKVVSFGVDSAAAIEVAAGAPLLVDVEFGLGRSLYALAQGHFSGGPGDDGSPADPETGSLVKVNNDGTFTTIVEGLDQPTSLEFIGNTAYVVTLGGEVYKIENVSIAPFGVSK